MDRRIQALASQVPGPVREYLELIVARELKEIVVRQAALQEALDRIENRYQGWAGNVQARINDVEEQIKVIPQTRAEVRTQLADVIADLRRDPASIKHVRDLAKANLGPPAPGRETPGKGKP